MKRVSCCALLLMACLTAPMLAQQPAASQPPASANEFVPLSEAAPREVLPATPLVFYAYGFVWVALLGYVFTIWRRMAQVERDLADVQRRLKDGGSAR
jgi:CcmD family protein